MSERPVSSDLGSKFWQKLVNLGLEDMKGLPRGFFGGRSHGIELKPPQKKQGRTC